MQKVPLQVLSHDLLCLLFSTMSLPGRGIGYPDLVLLAGSESDLDNLCLIKKMQSPFSTILDKISSFLENKYVILKTFVYIFLFKDILLAVISHLVRSGPIWAGSLNTLDFLWKLTVQYLSFLENICGKEVFTRPAKVKKFVISFHR